MLALLVPQAVLGAERRRSMASPREGGSMAPALHIVGAQISDMSRSLFLRALDGRGSSKEKDVE
jgi:hypothetical protein